MPPHPFDILGLLPSLYYSKDDVQKAKRVANWMLEKNGGQYCSQRDGVKYVYDAAKVNDCADKLVKVIEAGGLMFCILEWGEYTSNWNPQVADHWDQPITGWETCWDRCRYDIRCCQRDAVSWAVGEGEYKHREQRAELEQMIKQLNEETAESRQKEEVANRGLIQAVADLGKEISNHNETKSKLQLLEAGLDDRVQKYLTDQGQLEEDQENIDHQREQLEMERQQHQADLDRFRQEREAFHLLKQQHQADRDQLRQEPEAFDLQRWQIERERDLRQRPPRRDSSNERLDVQRASRQEIEEGCAALSTRIKRQQRRAQNLKFRQATIFQKLKRIDLEIQQKEDEAERETRFLDETEAKISYFSGNLDGLYDNDTGSQHEDDLLAPPDLTTFERAELSQGSPSREPPSQLSPAPAPFRIPAPSQTPPPSRAPSRLLEPTETGEGRLELGKTRDGLPVFGGINKRGKIFRRVKGHQARKTSIKHTEVIYKGDLSNKSQEDVDGIIRNFCQPRRAG